MEISKFAVPDYVWNVDDNVALYSNWMNKSQGWEKWRENNKEFVIKIICDFTLS